ncbi:NERD domain-containing protein [Streptomyces sp. NBC_00390]|uniref:nuclease-related domain-containing protein n=1 Tax=Streptomyces sp. NBC_00390 TaxID=2975736 RepID=UPI002E1E628B
MPACPQQLAGGRRGEARTARLLAPLARKGHALVLHDRAVPNSRANLDHLVFTVAGAAYVDTKNWTSGKSRLTVQGSTLRYGQYDQSHAPQTVVWEAEQACARRSGAPGGRRARRQGRRAARPHGDRCVTVVEARRLRGLPRSLPPQPGWDSASKFERRGIPGCQGCRRSTSSEASPTHAGGASFLTACPREARELATGAGDTGRGRPAVCSCGV